MGRKYSFVIIFPVFFQFEQEYKADVEWRNQFKVDFENKLQEEDAGNIAGRVGNGIILELFKTERLTKTFTETKNLD